MPAYDPALKCLCNYCSTGVDGKHRLSQDVYFFNHDFVGLKSEEKDASDKRAAEGAAMKCAVPVPKQAPEPALVKQVQKAKKPQPKLF